MKKIITMVYRVWDIIGWGKQKEMIPWTHEHSDLLVRLILGITAKGSRLLDLLNCYTSTVPTIDPPKTYLMLLLPHIKKKIISGFLMQQLWGNVSSHPPDSSRYQTLPIMLAWAEIIAPQKPWISREIRRKRWGNKKIQIRVRNKVNVGEGKLFVWGQFSTHWQNFPGEKPTRFGQ